METMHLTLECVSLFAYFRGRTAPVAPSRSWPVAVAALIGNRAQGAAEALRRAGAWESAALLEDGRLAERARRVIASRAKRGWSPLSILDPAYPPRLRERLGAAAPPLLWSNPKSDETAAKLVGVVGSRDLTNEESDFAAMAGATLAKRGFGVVSGGARGADQVAASASLEAGGFVAHFLPGGGRPNLGSACLLAEDPEAAPFNRLAALTRNRWIYAASEGVILIASRLGVGGSWSGAIAARRERTCPLAVFIGRDPSPGNDCLARLGAAKLRTENDVEHWLCQLPERQPSLPLG
jgi:predicted Rossmann fold nucleotide-binding protein DprA/Smf involved in DNA uptake